MSRTWGPWTEVKLDALSNYLEHFVVASQRAKGTLYLDLFAGAPENAARDGRAIMGSPSRALDVTPAISKSIFFELQPRSAAQLEKDLRERYPGRDFHVVAGDCNTEIKPALAQLEPGWRHAPTFAFVDQYAAEVSWETLQALADFKDPSRTKVELWLFFADGLIPRGAYGEDGPVLSQFADRVDRMFGSRRWRELLSARYEGWISPAELRAELVNFMRWRLQKDLGYKTTIPLAVHNETGVPIYTMIFATDHDVGEKIMTSVLGIAAEDLTRMKVTRKARRIAEKDDAFGVGALFSPEEAIGTLEASPTLLPPKYPWILDRED